MQAFMFPGQGSQSVGMGKALADEYPVARAVFDEVDEALGESLSRVVFEGPDAELTLTANAQPALLAVSLAALRVFEAASGKVLADRASFVAGHSLGEYSALAAAGSLSLGEAAKLLRLRGRAMQAAVPAGEGAMAALIGVEPEVAASIAEMAAEGDTCQVANDNGGGQVVLSGTAAAVSRAVAVAKSRGVKRAVLLPVSAPFHCTLMRPAADTMAEALAGADIRPPSVPVVVNVLAQPTADPAAIRRALVDQVCGTVRWRETLAFLAAAGVTSFVEFGAGKVLSGLAKRVVPAAEAVSVGTPGDLGAALATV